MPVGGAGQNHGQRRVGHGDGVGCGANAPSQAVCGGGVDGVRALGQSREVGGVGRHGVSCHQGVIHVELHRADGNGRADRHRGGEGYRLSAAEGLAVGRGGQHGSQRVGQDGQDVCRRGSRAAVRIQDDHLIGIGARRKHPEGQQEGRGARPRHSRQLVVGVERRCVGSGAARHGRR